MSSTPRSKPMARPSSPRAERPGSAAPSAKPASSSSDKPKEKKPKAKKPKAPPRPNADSFESKARVDVPISNVEELGVDDARAQLSELQKKYGALIVNFNNQQAELQAARKTIDRLEKSQGAGPALTGDAAAIQEQLQSTLADLRAEEEKNMALQKKINKLQVEHVSEEEVDQLFYALEIKEQQLAQAQRDKAGLEQEVLTARQLTARGTNYAEPKYIEIHHQHNLSDDSDDDSDDE